MFPRQAHPWEDQCCCRSYFAVADRTRTHHSAQPRRPTNTSPHSLATLAHNALSTMNVAFAPSSARRYENNWTRFITFVQKLDRKRRYMPASPNTVIAFVQHLKNEGKAPNTIRSFLSPSRNVTRRVAILTLQMTI